MHQEHLAQQYSRNTNTSLWQAAPAWRWFLVGAVLTSFAGVGVGVWRNSAPPISADTSKTAAIAPIPSMVLTNTPVTTPPVTPTMPDSVATREKIKPLSESQLNQKSIPVIQSTPRAPMQKKDIPQSKVSETKPEPVPTLPTKEPAHTPPSVSAPVSQAKEIPPIISIEEANKNCPKGPLMVRTKYRPLSSGKIVAILSAQTSRAMIESSMVSAHGDQDPKYLNDLLADIQSADGKTTRVSHIHGVDVKIGDRIVFDWPYADPSVPCRYVPNVIKGVLPPLPPTVEAPTAPSQ